MKTGQVLRFLGALFLGFGLVLAFGVGGFGLVYTALEPGLREGVLEALRGRLPYLLLLALLLLLVLALMLQPLFLGYLAATRALAREAEVILKANPGHRLRLKGPWELRELGRLVNLLAEAHEAKEKELQARVEEARKLLLEERNRLSALLGHLPQGVVVTNRLGQVVLYNPKAKDLLPGLSLGKSLFSLLDRNLLAHALEAQGLPFRAEGLRFRALPLEEGGFVLFLEAWEEEGEDQEEVFRALRARAGALTALAEALPLVPEEEQAKVLGLLKAEVQALAGLLRRERPRAREGQNLRELVQALARGLEDALGLAPGVSLEEEAYVALDRSRLLKTLPDLARALEGSEGVYIRGRGWNGFIRLEILPLAQEPRAFLEAVRTEGGEAWREGEALVLLLPRLPVPKEGPKVEERPPSYDLRLLEPPEGPLRARPLREILYTAFDLETTGLSPKEDRILAIGAVHLLGDRVLKEEVFEALVNPGRPIPKESTRIHGLRDEDVQDKPFVAKVLPQFHRFQEETVLLAHNGAFDLAFLKEEGERLGLEFPGFFLDTLLLGQFLFPEGRVGLEALCERLGVPVLGRHTALGDALMTAEVFRRMLPLLEERGIRTLAQALEAMAQVPLARLKY